MTSLAPFDVVCSLVRSSSGRVAIISNAFSPNCVYVYTFEFNLSETFIILLAVNLFRLIVSSHLPNSYTYTILTFQILLYAYLHIHAEILIFSPGKFCKVLAFLKCAMSHNFALTQFSCFLDRCLPKCCTGSTFHLFLKC